jgi:hypothetical protein
MKQRENITENTTTMTPTCQLPYRLQTVGCSDKRRRLRRGVAAAAFMSSSIRRCSAVVPHDSREKTRAQICEPVEHGRRQRLAKRTALFFVHKTQLRWTRQDTVSAERHNVKGQGGGGAGVGKLTAEVLPLLSSRLVFSRAFYQ